jgi:hypothetical protein
MWTYKVAFPRGGKTLWGWVCSPAGLEKLDPFRDTEQEWNRKVGQFDSDKLIVQEEIGAAIRGR